MRLLPLILALALVSVGCNSATAQSNPAATGCVTRTAVAGTWALSFSGNNYKIHLAGCDLAVSGAWIQPADVGVGYSGALTGDFASGVLRLDMHASNSSTQYVGYLLDLNVAANGTSASGLAYTLSNGYPSYAATMTRIAPPTP